MPKHTDRVACQNISRCSLSKYFPLRINIKTKNVAFSNVLSIYVYKTVPFFCDQMDDDFPLTVPNT